MLLATQCPHCQTRFKVAHDQLKLQSGLVRCGVCRQVFNGIEHLADGNVSGSASAAPARTVLTEPDVEETTKSSTDSVDDMFSSFGFGEATKTAPYLDNTTPIQPIQRGNTIPVGQESKTPAMQEGAPPTRQEAPVTLALSEEFSPNQSQAKLAAKVQALLDAELSDPPASAVPAPAIEPYIDDVLMLEEHDANELAADPLQPAQTGQTSQSELADVGFIRQARNRRRMTWLLSGATFLLGLCLVVQLVFQFRNLIAAAYPETRPALSATCALLGCQISLPIQPDAISYEADELHTLARPHTFEFSLLMRNRGSLTQAWPAIELTMKDSHKQPVVRRVFTPAEYLGNTRSVQAGFAAGQEQQVKLYFVMEQEPVTDYLVALFYP